MFNERQALLGDVRLDSSTIVNLAPNTTVDGPSLKLDQHESSHCRTLHVIDDALLNMMDYMP